MWWVFGVIYLAIGFGCVLIFSDDICSVPIWVRWVWLLLWPVPMATMLLYMFLDTMLER